MHDAWPSFLGIRNNNKKHSTATTTRATGLAARPSTSASPVFLVPWCSVQQERCEVTGPQGRRPPSADVLALGLAGSPAWSPAVPCMASSTVSTRSPSQPITTLGCRRPRERHCRRQDWFREPREHTPCLAPWHLCACSCETTGVCRDCWSRWSRPQAPLSPGHPPAAASGLQRWRGTACASVLPLWICLPPKAEMCDERKRHQWTAGPRERCEAVAPSSSDGFEDDRRRAGEVGCGEEAGGRKGGGYRA